MSLISCVMSSWMSEFICVFFIFIHVACRVDVSPNFFNDDCFHKKDKLIN